MPEEPRRHDLVVIGGGPAGLSAALAAAEAGLRTAVLDESPQLGGRLLGQLHEKPGRSSEWWNGTEIAHDLVVGAHAAGIDLHPHTTVWNVERGFQVFATASGEQRRWAAPNVLLATGAAEEPVPVPGWELPGVLSIGGAQVLVNVHRVRPGRRAIVVGINVLSVAIARELALAGVEVLGLVLPPPGTISGQRADPVQVVRELVGLSHLAPAPILRTLGPRVAALGLHRVATHVFPRSGFRLWGIPIRPTVSATRIFGDDHVTGVELAHVSPGGQVRPRTAHRVDVDLVCIAGGLYPLIEIANAIGCVPFFDEHLGGHVPLHDEHFRTTVAGLYVAGSNTGVEGAEVAMAQGRAAGLAIALDASGGARHRAAFQEAKEAVVETRARAAIRFVPTIETGRSNLLRAWSRHQASQVRP